VSEWTAWAPESFDGATSPAVASTGTETRCTSNAIAWHESGLTFALLAVAGLAVGRSGWVGRELPASPEL
jgi:hypothetical protein